MRRIALTAISLLLTFTPSAVAQVNDDLKKTMLTTAAAAILTTTGSEALSCEAELGILTAVICKYRISSLQQMKDGVTGNLKRGKFKITRPWTAGQFMETPSLQIHAEKQKADGKSMTMMIDVIWPYSEPTTSAIAVFMPLRPPTDEEPGVGQAVEEAVKPYFLPFRYSSRAFATRPENVNSWPTAYSLALRSRLAGR